MRSAMGLELICACLLVAGCAHHKTSQANNPAPPVTTTQPPATVIQPDLRVLGQVAMVNADARFVVVSFPPGAVPQIGQHLNVYHNGLKMAEIKVTGPQRESDTVADILNGE